MLTEEQIKEIDDAHNWQTTAGRMAAYRAIEQAVRKELESDARDAERWRFAVAPGLEQSMMWLDVYEDWDGSDDFAAAIDAARGQT